MQAVAIDVRIGQRGVDVNVGNLAAKRDLPATMPGMALLYDLLGLDAGVVRSGAGGWKQ